MRLPFQNGAYSDDGSCTGIACSDDALLVSYGLARVSRSDAAAIAAQVVPDVAGRAASSSRHVWPPTPKAPDDSLLQPARPRGGGRKVGDVRGAHSTLQVERIVIDFQKAPPW